MDLRIEDQRANQHRGRFEEKENEGLALAVGKTPDLPDTIAWPASVDRKCESRVDLIHIEIRN
jgi:hypothetical protein